MDRVAGAGVARDAVRLPRPLEDRLRRRDLVALSDGRDDRVLERRDLPVATALGLAGHVVVRPERRVGLVVDLLVRAVLCELVLMVERVPFMSKYIYKRSATVEYHIAHNT